MKAPNLNQLWADLIIAELARNGVRQVVVAPGSRSAPLVTAAARSRRVATLVHFDERGAAFAALGCGKMGKPAAVICTSGTALANCFPAVAEARQSATPLIIISADRPPELQNCGANQTICQPGIFGCYTLADAAIPCPDVSAPPATLLEKVDAALAKALAPGQGGPAHLNCMYREPLAPDVVNTPWPKDYMQELRGWEKSNAPYTPRTTTALALSEEQLQQITASLSQAQNGLLLIGPLATREERDAALRAAARLQWPVFADIASGCRCDAAGNNVISCFDLLLCSERFRARCVPDMVLHIGDVFVSKRLQEYLAICRPEYMQLTSRKEKRDPIHCVTQRFQVDIATACGQMANLASTRISSLLEPCRAINRDVRTLMAQTIETNTVFTELTIAEAVNAACSKDMALFIGNSMPIRNMDMAIANCNAFALRANRGVSGIDGNIATAAGMAWASEMPILAIIGDTAALHDLNSLALLTKINVPVILVIINNCGGGIFSFLPIAKYADILEPYFINSHEWRFDRAAAMFGLPYHAADSRDALKKALKNAVNSGISVVIEAYVAREENVQAHNTLTQTVTAMLASHRELF